MIKTIYFNNQKKMATQWPPFLKPIEFYSIAPPFSDQTVSRH
jgi:hypothetical protein